MAFGTSREQQFNLHTQETWTGSVLCQRPRVSLWEAGWPTAPSSLYVVPDAPASLVFYLPLRRLVPDLMKLMDEKKLGFTTAVELSYISKKNQNYIAVAVDSQQSSPSQAQAKRMRELDEKKLLNGDVIDGIMMEDKKEVDIF